MVETMELPDPSVVSRYLRRDILRNCGLLASIERNIPPFPRTVWAAWQDGQLVGTMLVTEGPGQGMVGLRADGTEAVEPLLRCLDPGRPYSLSIPAALLDAFLRTVPRAVYQSQTIVLSAHPQDLRQCPTDLEYRRLFAADKPAVAAFCERASYEPPLTMYLDWALARPQDLAICGLFEGARLIGYVGWAVQIAPVWEATFIRIRSDRQRQGLGRALLGRSTRDLLAAGHIPLYELDSRNQASLRIAVAAGYHEVSRVHHYEAVRL